MKNILYFSILICFSSAAQVMKGDTLFYNDQKIYKGQILKLASRDKPFAFILTMCGFARGEFASHLWSKTEVTVAEILTKPNFMLRVKSKDCKFNVFIPGAIDFKEIE